MQVNIKITISEQTPEEVLTARGGSREQIRDLYLGAFAQILEKTCTPGVTYDLRVDVTDNTKEAKK